MLSTDPELAKKVVMGKKPAITAESEKLDPATLEEMCLNVGTLATVYLKPVQQVFRNARLRKVAESPALQRHTLPTQIEMEQYKHLPSILNGPVPPPDMSDADGPTNKKNLAAAVDAADE